MNLYKFRRRNWDTVQTCTGNISMQYGMQGVQLLVFLTVSVGIKGPGKSVQNGAITGELSISLR